MCIGKRSLVDCELFWFNSFFAQQDHRVDSERTPGGNQGGYETYAEHGKNDAAEDDRVFRRGLIHDRRQDTRCQYTEDHASYRSNGEQPEGTSERCTEQFVLTGPEGYADAEVAEAFADGIGGHTEDTGNRKHGAQQAQRAVRDGGYARGDECRIQLVVPGPYLQRYMRIGA